MCSNDSLGRYTSSCMSESAPMFFHSATRSPPAPLHCYLSYLQPSLFIGYVFSSNSPDLPSLSCPPLPSDIHSFFNHLIDPPFYTPIPSSLLSCITHTWPLPTRSLPDFWSCHALHSFYILAFLSVYLFCSPETWNAAPIIYKGAGSWCRRHDCQSLTAGVIVYLWLLWAYKGVIPIMRPLICFFFFLTTQSMVLISFPVTLSLQTQTSPPFQKLIRSTWF